MEEKKVLIVEDNVDILNLLETYLKNSGFLVQTAKDGFSALKKAKLFHPDVVVLDIIIPHLDGFEVCRRIRELEGHESTHVIYISGLNTSTSIVKGLTVGGDDYLIKPIDPDVLVAKIKAYFRSFQRKKEAKRVAAKRSHLLSFREIQILQFIKDGYKNKEIADRLNLTEGTVKVYNHNIFQKLNVNNRTQAIVRAEKLQLLS